MIIAALELGGEGGLGGRASAAKRPFIVVDAAGPEQTTVAIRAGASDMLLHGAPDET